MKQHTSEKRIQNSTEPHEWDVYELGSATLRPSLSASCKVSNNSQGYSNSSLNRNFYKSAQSSKNWVYSADLGASTWYLGTFRRGIWRCHQFPAMSAERRRARSSSRRQDDGEHLEGMADQFHGSLSRELASWRAVEAEEEGGYFGGEWGLSVGSGGEEWIRERSGGRPGPAWLARWPAGPRSSRGGLLLLLFFFFLVFCFSFLLYFLLLFLFCLNHLIHLAIL
mgnify:CR=1 FL=1